MELKKRKKNSKNKYFPPEIKRYKITELATQWNMDTIGAITPCGQSPCTCGGGAP